jgi:hypothetical protein
MNHRTFAPRPRIEKRSEKVKRLFLPATGAKCYPGFVSRGCGITRTAQFSVLCAAWHSEQLYHHLYGDSYVRYTVYGVQESSLKFEISGFILNLYFFSFIVLYNNL